MAVLNDSGSRREFDSGAVRDIAEGKGRCDLLPLDEVARLLEFADNMPQVYKGLSPIEAIACYLELERGEEPFIDSGELLFYALTEFSRRNFWNLPTMLLEVSKHFEDGCNKYGERNWEAGIPAHCYIDSAIRHYLKWKRGDTDEPHDRAFCWNLLCLLWTLRNRPECNDLVHEYGDG